MLKEWLNTKAQADPSNGCANWNGSLCRYGKNNRHFSQEMNGELEPEPGSIVGLSSVFPILCLNLPFSLIQLSLQFTLCLYAKGYTIVHQVYQLQMTILLSKKLLYWDPLNLSPSNLLYPCHITNLSKLAIVNYKIVKRCHPLVLETLILLLIEPIMTWSK